jgi:hypothetical protein
MEKIENIINDTNDISRKEALKKMGKYYALASMGTFMFLSPKKAQASSPDTAPDPGEW